MFALNPLCMRESVACLRVAKTTGQQRADTRKAIRLWGALDADTGRIRGCSWSDRNVRYNWLPGFEYRE